MAQRTSTSRQTITTLGWVEKPKPRKRRPTNDNKKLPTSGLRFREQKTRSKRAEDLSWQIKFALMKLHHWRDVDNPDWAPLDKLLKAAQMECSDLDLV